MIKHHPCKDIFLQGIYILKALVIHILNKKNIIHNHKKKKKRKEKGNHNIDKLLS